MRLASVPTLLALASTALSEIIRGVNQNGHPFKVRTGAEVTFASPVGSNCEETFLFPGADAGYVARMSSATDISPCTAPTQRDFEALRSLVPKMSITAFVTCSTGRVQTVWVGCLMNGVGVSRRTADITEGLENDLPTRVQCDATHESVLVECAKSVLNYMAIKKVVLSREGASNNIQKDAPKATTTLAPTTTTDQPDTKAENVTDESVGVSTEVESTARQLTDVAGRNKANYSFRILDDGVVSFTPRVGEECSESYIFDGFNTTQKFHAMVSSDFAPCNPPALGTPMDASWKVTPKVDCTDPVWITINCTVSFGEEGKDRQMSRRAKLQGIPQRKYLSTRISCGAPGLNEQMECATIAQHYIAIQKLVPN